MFEMLPGAASLFSTTARHGTAIVQPRSGRHPGSEALPNAPPANEHLNNGETSLPQLYGMYEYSEIPGPWPHLPFWNWAFDLDCFSGVQGRVAV